MCFGGGGDASIDETEDQKELAQIGIEKWQDYQEMYPEVEAEFFSSVERLDSDSYQQRAANEGATSVSDAYTDAANETTGQILATGSNPNSGRFKGAINALDTGEAVSRATTSTQAQQSLQDSYLTGKSNIVAMGNGVEGEALQGFGEIAQASGNKAISDAQSSYNSSANTQSAVGTAIGTGAGLYSLNKASDEE